MRYRKLDSDGDYSFGNGAADFWKDQPEAVAQAVQTRLFLFEGEWFLDSREGMTWNTQVLGVRTANTRDPAIRRRVLGTQGAKALLDYSSSLNRDTRGFSVNMTIDTIYGPATLSGVNV
ncbi:hypothetical protein [Bosea sp. AS-1]|uniref:hypothetical protein n=1 Tax=Bosea sp. AS-1 TaxID=2015316 RepID=UPI000B76D28F|nr:hypothetical protein [Bosea sp. AS-1]